MQFVCRYGTPDGQVLTETHEGSDVAAIERELERQGFHIFEVRPRGGALLPGWPFRRRRKLVDGEKATLKAGGMQFHDVPAAAEYLKVGLESAYERMAGRIKDRGRSSDAATKLRKLYQK